MGVRLTMAGIGLVVLAAGCGGTSPISNSAGPRESTAATGTTELPALTGQQVCDLVGKQTLTKHLPQAQSTNSTTRSTTTEREARCDSKSLDGGKSSRFLEVTLMAGIPRYVDESTVDGGTAEQAAKERMTSAREGVASEELPGVGEEAFTAFAQDADGATRIKGAVRDGIWVAEIVFHGADRPNPDDRDNKVYLPKDVLVATVTELATEIVGNLPTLAAQNAPTKPGELNGDALCASVSTDVLARYLPKAKTETHTGAATEHGASAECRWRSAQPRPDSPGLRILEGRVGVLVTTARPEPDFADMKQDAQEEHDEGPDPSGPNKGSTSDAPQDVPGLGRGAFLVLSHSSADSKYPTTNAKLVVLLSDKRIITVSYSGTNAAELDTGSGSQGDLGQAKPITDGEATEAATAMVKDVLAKLD